MVINQLNLVSLWKRKKKVQSDSINPHVILVQFSLPLVVTRGIMNLRAWKWSFCFSTTTTLSHEWQRRRSEPWRMEGIVILNICMRWCQQYRLWLLPRARAGGGKCDKGVHFQKEFKQELFRFTITFYLNCFSVLANAAHTFLLLKSHRKGNASFPPIF